MNTQEFNFYLNFFLYLNKDNQNLCLLESSVISKLTYKKKPAIISLLRVFSKLSFLHNQQILEATLSLKRVRYILN